MVDFNSLRGKQNEEISFDSTQYAIALRNFDIAVCEAIAVSQGAANRMERAFVGYSTHLFTRLCSHSRALIEACPNNRWVKRYSHSWDLAFTAPHSRAIMEGYLLFFYISENPKSEDEWLTKLNIMHLNDCARRKRLFLNYKLSNEEIQYTAHENEIKERLNSNPFFQNLDPTTKKQALNGKILMIPTRDIMLESICIDVGFFNGLFDLLSNYTHVLPMSFYRMEPNGRGTGMSNDADLGYTTLSLIISSELLGAATDRMVELFPFTKKYRQGLNSRFSPGPKENRPKQTKHTKYD